MTTYLLNALPNSLLIPEHEGESRSVTRWPAEVAVRTLRAGFVSAVGHASTADALSRLTGLNIQANRIAVAPAPGDVLIVAAVRTPRRLGEGQVYTEEEILAMPVVWAFVQI